jgi:sodium-dependent dicarboxylate transporter 2/3/5
VLAATAIATGISPMLLMVPAVLSASCAFMLPVATAPNAIVFGSGKVRIKDMARAGFVLNLVGAIVVTTVCLLVLD